ncbi:MAG: hypothetical protein ACRBN8_16025 [Nannocystales bacterium]
MFQRSAARPLALTAALLFFPACDSGDSDGGGTDTDAATSGTTTDPGSTTNPATTTTASGTTTTDPGTTGGESSTGSDSGSSGSESGSSGSSESGSSSSGGEAIGYADLYGDYDDNFGAFHTLSAESWSNTFPGFDAIVVATEEVNDDERWIAGLSMGGLEGYERLDWDFDEDGQLRYCSGAFGEETLEDAVNAPPSDRTDFETGCGGGASWTVMTPAR